MKPKFRSLIAAFHPLQRAAIVITATVCAAAAHADQTWTGASDALWDTAGNWNSAVPAADENAVFDASSIANLSIDTNADQSVGGIVLSSPSGPVTISNNTLTLGAGGIDMSAATQDLTIASTVAPAGSQEWSVASGQLLTLSSTLAKPVGSVVNFDLSAGGAVNVATGTASAILPGATYNGSDLAGLDGSNNVVSGSASGAVYVPNPANDIYFNPASATYNVSAPTYDVIDVVQDNAAITGSGYRLTTSSYFGDGGGVRFNVPHPSGEDWVVDGKNPHYANAAHFHILVGSAVDTDVIFQGTYGPRGNVSGGSDVDLSNFSSNKLIFRSPFTQGGGKNLLVTKNGSGPVVFSNDGNTCSFGYYINEGAVYIGEDGGSTGALGGGGITIAAGASLNLNRVDAGLNVANVISGDGVVNQVGGGTTTLSGINTFTGGLGITNGTLAASAIDNVGAGDITIDGGAFQFAAAFDLTAGNVVIGSSGATFDTNGNAVSFANGFQTGSAGSVTVTGAGSLSLDGDNDYSGGTSVDGTLLANATTSSTGTGTVTVNSGGTLGGDGVISGSVDVASGGKVSPGSSVGELTVGSLSLAAGSTGLIEFNSNPANDHVVVTSGGGLTINGGSLELVEEGTSTPFTTPGTYNLFGYSGAIGGAGVSALSVSNPQPGFGYTFAATGSEVTVTIATTGVVSQWITDGSGLWTDGGNWSAAIPNGAGETALFTTSLTNPAETVDLNGPKTVGAMAFDSANGYTLTQGGAGALNLSSGTVDPVQVAIIDGVHEIAADVSLVSTFSNEALDAADGLNVSGEISGSGGITKTGDGVLGLLGSNTFTGSVDLQGGTTTFASGGLGAGSNLDLDNAALVWDTGNTDDVSSKTVAFGSNPVTFDTNGNDVTLANAIGDSGASAFTKAGTGTLELSADATFTGDVTIADGTLQLGSGGTAGSVIGNIANSGVLAIDRSDNVSLTNVISGTGGLNQSGSGDLALPVANTFSGDTNILSGTLTLQDAAALQNSTLNYDSAGGSIGFDTLTAVTLGGLSGDLDLALENTTPAGVALTVGGNGSTTTYSGVLSGTGASLQKNGAGVLTLAGANTYDGATFVNEGTLEVTGSINGTIIASGAGDIINVNGGTITSSTFCDIEGQLNIDLGGEANYNGGVRGDNSDGSIINVIDGTLNATVVERRRDASLGNAATGPSVGPGGAGLVGLVVGGGGTANIGDLTIGTSNSSAQAVVDGGILNVTGTVSVAPSLSSGRWCLIDARSGECNITDTTNGLVLAPHAGNDAKAAFYASGAICKVGKITFGDAAAGLGTGLVDVTGELYMGSGGAVQAAPSFNTIFRLSGGTLGAYENWTSSVPVTLADTYNSYITGADEFGDPFDIELAGGLTGSGGVIKDGTGEVTVSGPITYTGDTQVWYGTLTLTSAGLADASNILVEDGDGAVLNLAFAGGDRVAEFADDSGTYTTGTVGAVGSGADHETAAVTGTGLLYLNEDPPVTAGYDSWATGAGLTALNNGPTQDAEFDGIDNVLEFVLGGDPLVSDTDILPALDASGANYVFSFTRDDESEAEVTLTFQYGSDLAGWTDVVIGADNGSSGSEVDIVEDGANPDQVTITVPKSGTEMFGRLRAVK